MVVFTRNPLEKTPRWQTHQMGIVLLFIRLLSGAVRPSLLVINGVVSRRKRRVMRRFLLRGFSVTGRASLSTHEAAHTAYSGFDSQKNHNDGKDVHDVPPLFDLPGI